MASGGQDQDRQDQDRHEDREGSHYSSGSHHSPGSHRSSESRRSGSHRRSSRSSYRDSPILDPLPEEDESNTVDASPGSQSSPAILINPLDVVLPQFIPCEREEGMSIPSDM